MLSPVVGRRQLAELPYLGEAHLAQDEDSPLCPHSDQTTTGDGEVPSMEFVSACSLCTLGSSCVDVLHPRETGTPCQPCTCT